MRMPRTFLPIATCLALIVACADWTTPVEIAFEIRFNGRPIGCEPDSTGTALTDLRFYVHDVFLIDTDGRRRPLRLERDGVWQNEAIALIDVEDGSGGCANGSGSTNRSVRGTVRGAGDARGLGFTIGVPDSLNHANPMAADAPLAYSVMHWHWRSGYKFMRAGVRTAGDLAWLHLGSSKCTGTIGDIRGCGAANRPTVELDDFDPALDRVVFDVGALLGPSDLDDGAAWDCQSGPSEARCGPVFSALGLDFDTGRSVAPASVFSRMPAE